MTESTSDWIWEVDENAVYTYTSPKIKELLGYEPEEIIGKTPFDLMTPEAVKRVAAEFGAIAEARKPFDRLENENLHRDGQILVLETSGVPIFDANGNFRGYRGIDRDITERKQADDLLRNAEADWRNSFNSLEDVMLIIDRDYNIENINEIGLKLLGKSKEEVIGEKCYQVISGADSPSEECPCMKSLETKKVESLDRYEERFGKYYSIQTSPIFDENGEIIKFVDLRRDITERKQAEERIEHLNSVLKAIRSVNQLITMEKDRNRLLQGACDNLIETRGYYNAWIALIDESGSLVTTAEASLGKDFLPLVERLKRGELTDCGQKALMQLQVVATEDPFSTCTNCPLSDKYHGRGALTVQLEYGEKVYGLLSVSVPKELTADEEEQTLFKEVAGDLAFALYRIGLEEEQKRAEDKVKEAYRLREYFLKETSHRIITPVAIIGGNTDLLLESSNLDEDQKEKIIIIRKRNEEVEKLVRDALAGKYLQEEEGDG